MQSATVWWGNDNGNDGGGIAKGVALGRASIDMPKAQGRPRSESAHRAILAAANRLLEQIGFHDLSVEAIAAEAGVSKATIYRWWPNKAAVVMDAFLAATGPQLSFPPDLPARESVRAQMRTLVDVFNAGAGRTVAALLGEAQADPDLAEAFRARWIANRRTIAREILAHGIATGELRPDCDLEVALDSLYGPLYFRLLVGHLPLTKPFVDQLIDQVFAGLHAT
jgi:AcrR family transcriptional regulator